MERSPAYAQAEADPARGSRLVEDPHLRPHRRNAPILFKIWLIYMFCQISLMLNANKPMYIKSFEMLFSIVYGAV